MALLFHKIVTPLARTLKVRSRERSLSYDLQTTAKSRKRAEARNWSVRAAWRDEHEVEPSALSQGFEEPVVVEEAQEMAAPSQPSAPPLANQPPLLASLAAEEEIETPPTMTESDLVSLAQAQDLEELLRSPLGQAIQRYLALRYPHLQEYEDLVLAEAGDLLHTDLGRQLVVMDPGEFVEAAVRRAIITVAEIRVGLRQAVRNRLAAQRVAAPGQAPMEAVERMAAH